MSVISGNVHIVYKHWDRLGSPKRQDLLRSALDNAASLSETIHSLNTTERIRPQRGKLAGVSTEGSTPGFEVGIELDFAGQVRRGEARLPYDGQDPERRAVVLATLNALEGLLPFAADVEAVEMVEVGSRTLAVVSLDRKSDTIVGSAVVRSGPDDAIARATLDALNRFLLNPALV